MVFPLVMYGCESWTLNKAVSEWVKSLSRVQLFAWGGQSIGVSASASVLPMNIQDWSIDWLDLLAVQGTLKSLLQHHSSEASVLWHSAFFLVTFLVAQMVKHLPTMWEAQLLSLGQEDLLEKEMAIHSSILPGKVHGQSILAGCSPWDYMTEHVCMRVEGDGLVAIKW